MYRYLFVGEQVNKRKSDIPFDKRYNSGKFLHDSIIYLENIEWIKVDFDNIYKGRKLNKSIKRKQYKYNEIIALGRVAEKELNRMNINCIYVPHPSFFKRFHSKEGINKYSQIILEAIANG